MTKIGNEVSPRLSMSFVWQCALKYVENPGVPATQIREFVAFVEQEQRTRNVKREAPKL